MMLDEFIFTLDISENEFADFGALAIRSDGLPLNTLKLLEKV